jgi:hypothetical protein
VTSSRHSRARLLALVVVWVLGTGVAHAYIGPGAGFAFAGSALALVATFFIAAGAIISWPVRLIWRLIVTGNPYKRARVKRVVILGPRRHGPRADHAAHARGQAAATSSAWPTRACSAR